MRFEREPNSLAISVPKKLLAGLTGIAIGISASGCENGYDPIRVPEVARYLGTSSDGSRRAGDTSGKSFLVQTGEANTIYCGKDINLGGDNPLKKEVRALSNGMAQVTCYGFEIDEVPVERFESSRPGSSEEAR